MIPAIEEHEELVRGARARGETPLVILPGAGFGTGTHETTQLCLEAIGAQAEHGLALDFGSGSGILSIALALRGFRVWGVEIDELALDNARENARLNALDSQVSWHTRLEQLPSGQKFDLLVANILRPVLVEFAPTLLNLLKPGAPIILSGLVESDVPQVVKAFGLGSAAQVRAKNEWRGIIGSSSNTQTV